MKIIYSLAFLLFFQFLFSCNQAPVVFKSTDGGQTWQDISKGLPENLRKDSIRGNSFFANDKGLFLEVGNGLYLSAPNATAPFWTKEIFPDEHSSIAPGKSGIAHNYWGVNLKKANGTSVWSPIFEISQKPRPGSVFETAGGTIFIGTDIGFFKTTDNGKTWKLVHTGSLAGHLAESNGVLVAISMKRIIRSTDDGENWTVVSSEGSMAFDVKQINGGFAAITGSESNTGGISTSYDGGKTWQPIEASLQNKVFIDSIERTWNDRPSVEKKVFNLFVSGNVIYAISSKGGC